MKQTRPGMKMKYPGTIPLRSARQCRTGHPSLTLHFPLFNVQFFEVPQITPDHNVYW